MASFIKVPQGGQKIVPGQSVPDNPIIPFIEGDGIGVDITPVMIKVVDAAVTKAYGGKKKIHWMEVYAGEKSTQLYGADEWLPKETFDALKEYSVSIKGPMTTPVGGGIRSLNVALRQELDLYQCVRPVQYFKGVPSPLKQPELCNMVIFRENTEDIYAGIEWANGTDACKKVIKFLQEEMGVKKIRFPASSGIGIKPISVEGTERLVRAAIKYAIADAFLQQILLRPAEYDVIATTNLNGDYISDALAAQVGGIGIAPGANISDVYACFEATHGTAPKYAGKDKVNPGSLILSAEMMLRHMGWLEAADLIIKSMEAAIGDKVVTYDFARLMDGATEVSCSAFGDAMIARM